MPPREQPGDLLGVDLVVLGLAAVDGLHVQRVAEDEGDPLGGAEVGEPVPGEHALAADDQPVAVRGQRRQEVGPGSGGSVTSRTIAPAESSTQSDRVLVCRSTPQ